MSQQHTAVDKPIMFLGAALPAVVAARYVSRNSTGPQELYLGTRYPKFQIRVPEASKPLKDCVARRSACIKVTKPAIDTKCGGVISDGSDAEEA